VLVRAPTDPGFQRLDPAQDLAKPAVKLIYGHIVRLIRREQEETDFALVARTSFAETLHEQPHQLGMLGWEPEIDLLGVGHAPPHSAKPSFRC